MKAIVINNDKSLSYKNVNDPSIRDDEVLIEVYACAINRADLLQREGSYPPPPGCPDYPGLEVAGIIKNIGKNVTKFKIGENVCALLGGGGYAELVAVNELMVMHMPKNMSYVEASAIPEVYATAYLNLFYVGKAKRGDTLLMNAGASGLASAVIPMAKAFGLYVITTVLGPEKVKAVSYLNADRVVDTLNENIIDVLKNESENGHPVDIAIDCLGGEIAGQCFPYVNRGCRWIQIATLAGDITSLNLKTVYVKNIKLIGSTLRSKTVEEKGKILTNLENDIFPKFESGVLKVNVYKTLPIEKADEGHQILYRGENVGKVVLKIR